MPIASPIEIITRGPARAAARLFRFDGRLHVAVIAKTRLLLQADGPMLAREPHEVDRGTTTESVPYRPGTDVTFTGKLHTKGRKTQQTVARIAILRPFELGGTIDRSETLLNKTLCAFEIEKFGPQPPSARHELLSPPERSRVEAPLPELWSAMDFGYFHDAPSDQQTEHLRGDEWLWLERLHPSVERFASQLPLLRAIGMIRLAQQEHAFVMRIDTLTIDGENACCDVLARGSFALGNEQDLQRIAVVAGFEVGRLAPAEQAIPRSPATVRAGRGRDGTMIMQPAAEAPPSAVSSDRTMVLQVDVPAASPPPAAVALPQVPMPLPLPAYMTRNEQPAEEAAPLTIMSSALDARKQAADAAPATRAPFQLARAGAHKGGKSADMPGAPWAAGAAPKVTPAGAGVDLTVDAGALQAAAQQLQVLVEAQKQREAQASEKIEVQVGSAQPLDPWRNLPEDRAPAPKASPAPRPKIGVPDKQLASWIQERLRKR